MSVVSVQKGSKGAKKQEKKLSEINNVLNNLHLRMVDRSEKLTKLSSTSGLLEHPKYLTNDRINEIKREVENAVKLRKVFYVCGHYRSIRRALLERGWIEKMQIKSSKGSPGSSPPVDPNSISNDAGNEYLEEYYIQNLPEPQIGETTSQHLRKCELAIKARMLQSHPANFYWNIRKESLVWLNTIPRDALINRFPRARFTSKEGLCSILQQMHWYTEPGVAQINFPRCYNLSYPDQLNSFIDDFRLTACMGMIKSFLAILLSEGEIGVRSIAGSISISILHFAIDRCNEYIATVEHIDLDEDCRKVWDHEWENYFSWWDQFIHHKRRFLHKAGDEGIEIIQQKAMAVIAKMSVHWPQYHMDGMRNIWIVKPGNRSRGQGIILMDKFQTILSLVVSCNPKRHRYVVQKYVERPLLIYETKFDIRQWFLLTSAQPLVLWMYKECYLRFSSQLFNLDDFHESIHLTNNAVQKKYRAQADQQRSKELPEENMWDCYTFKSYLKRIGQYEKWDNLVYPAMKEAIVGSMLASQEYMDRKGNYFELYGADFVVGTDLVPWLLEINSSPDMSSSTSVTSRMCPQCLEDLIKVVVDRRDDPFANTGLFELVYKQQCPRPPAYLGLQLTIRGRRMTRHRVPKGARSAIVLEDEPEKSPNDDYQGPIIGDFIEELQNPIPQTKPKRRKRTGTVRAKRAVQQTALTTIQMKSQTPVVRERSGSRKTLKEYSVLKTPIDLNPSIKNSIKINRKTCYTRVSDVWKPRSSGSLRSLKKQSEEIIRDLVVAKQPCPRLVRSMCDHVKPNFSKNVLQSFLTVGLNLNTYNANHEPAALNETTSSEIKDIKERNCVSTH